MSTKQYDEALRLYWREQPGSGENVIFLSQDYDNLISDNRLAVNQGMVLGGDGFEDEIERLCNRRVRPSRMG